LRDFESDFQTLCQRLRQARANGRIGHAYLLAGDAADYLESFARAWIQTCACLEPQADGEACGACEACRRLAHSSYADLFELRPQSKARFIVVDDVRGLEHQLSLKGTPGMRKFGLILDADRMNEQAQNAFLKTLEEPAPRTTLLLVTTNPRALLPTIRSRCQNVALLRNRKDYSFAVQTGLFPELAKLHPKAGAATAIAVSSRLVRMFEAVREEALEAVGPAITPEWETYAESDTSVRKQLEDEHTVKVEAEYRRIRQELAEGILNWFLQIELIAEKAPHKALPHPELLDAAGGVGPEQLDAGWIEAQRNTRLAQTLLRHLEGGLYEQLALDAFCLGVCRRHA
jgi:DNA polymerase-3 subunit delta'